jgi:hypothetical protein
LTPWFVWWFFALASSSTPAPSSAAAAAVAGVVAPEALQRFDFLPPYGVWLSQACEAHAQDVPAGMPSSGDAYACELAARGTAALDGRACARAAAHAGGDVGAWLRAAAPDCDCLEQRADWTHSTPACR